MMTFVSLRRPAALLHLGLGPWLAAAALLLTGCGPQEIRVYSVPKERSGEAPWTVPAGWEAIPGDGMRLARFAVRGNDGAAADIAVITLNLSASTADIVNIWREQIKLPSLGESEVTAQARKVPVGSSTAELFEMVSSEPVLEGGRVARVLVALLKHENNTWIVKMTGTDGLVTGQKAAFLAFLESFRPDDLAAFKAAQAQLLARASARGGMDRGAARPAAPRPDWTVPSGWKEIPNPQMLLAKFRVTGDDGATLDVNVSMEEGGGGGLLGNVNRWRGQLGLDPVSETELARQVTLLDVGGPQASFVDLSGTNAMNGQPARILGVVVVRGEQTWFYKLMGASALAARERDAFLKFVQTARYPNG